MQNHPSSFSFLKTLIALVTALFLLSPSLSHAGCGEEKGSAWVIDTTTNKTVKKVSKGTIRQCANVDGSFEGFRKGNFYAGTAMCTANCADGFKPNVLYIKIGEKFSEGDVSGTDDNAVICVQQRGDKNKYCWKPVR